MRDSIYTKSGQEDSIATPMQGIGIGALNPKLKSRKFRQNRHGEVMVTRKSQKVARGDAVIIKGGPFNRFSGIFESGIRRCDRITILPDTPYLKLEPDSYCLAKV